MDPEEAAHRLIRNWMVEIVRQRAGVIGLADSQRAKFEGWLKVELADAASKNGATNVEFEPTLVGGRADLSFDLGGVHCVVELKTPNTSYRMGGVRNRQRPITMNIASIIDDAQKLRRSGGGVVAFILFPLPGSAVWQGHLRRISEGVGQALTVEEHVSIEALALPNGGNASMAIVTFEVPALDQADANDLLPA